MYKTAIETIMLKRRWEKHCVNRKETLKIFYVKFQRLLRFLCRVSSCFNFAGCRSFFESSSPYILGVFDTTLENSIDPFNFSLWVYPLIQTNSVTHMYDLVVYVKDRILFHMTNINKVNFQSKHLLIHIDR